MAAMLRGSAARVCRRRLFTSPFDLKVHEISRKETVPFSADQLFAVIADVDAYAKFLPFCTASRVVGRHGPESFDAELGIGFLAFDERYVSRVTLERPRAVSAVATNSGPFAHCRTAWRLRDADADAPGCELDFRLSMQMRTLLHDQALRRVIDRVVDQQVAAFRSRCEALYPDGATPTRLSTRLHVVGSAPSASASTPPPSAAGAPGAAAAPPPPPLLQIDPSWRHAVEAAFDAHASGGHLSLRGFVQACRALDARGGVFPESVAALLAPRDGGAAESGGGGGGGAAARASSLGRSEVQQLLAAAAFLHFDDDASGTITRDEFRNHLWLLARASSGEKCRYAFAKLDLNCSGRLEREDVVGSLHRQLRLVRALVPLLGRRAAAARGATVGAEAAALTESVLDGLSNQVDTVADELLERLAVERGGAISLERWSALWELHPELASLTDVEGTLREAWAAAGAGDDLPRK